VWGKVYSRFFQGILRFFEFDKVEKDDVAIIFVENPLYGKPIFVTQEEEKLLDDVSEETDLRDEESVWDFTPVSQDSEYYDEEQLKAWGDASFESVSSDELNGSEENSYEPSPNDCLTYLRENKLPEEYVTRTRTNNIVNRLKNIVKNSEAFEECGQFLYQEGELQKSDTYQVHFPE